MVSLILPQGGINREVTIVNCQCAVFSHGIFCVCFVLFFCLNVFHGCLYAGAFIKNKLFIKHMSIKVTFNIRKLKVKSPKF